ncbi:MAG: hypothetical protein KA995_04000 [Paludibacteraceae bacterium]|nr:hypothetical protein [Paludibacteraceae bacterium]
MEYNIGNLKRRSQEIADETRKGANTAKRIGVLFYDIVSEIESIYKKSKQRNFILSYLAVVISVFALILSFLKSDDINVDGANLLGWIIAVLAVLVTLLIGFQIYRAIEIENVIEKKMDSIESRMFESLKDLASRISEEKIRDIINEEKTLAGNKLYNQ